MKYEINEKTSNSKKSFKSTIGMFINSAILLESSKSRNNDNKKRTKRKYNIETIYLFANLVFLSIKFKMMNLEPIEVIDIVKRL